MTGLRTALRARLHAGLVFAALLWVVALLYVVGALRLQTTARVLPLVVSIPTLVALSANLAVAWRNGTSPERQPPSQAGFGEIGGAYEQRPGADPATGEEPRPAEAPVDLRSELRMIAWVAFLLALTLVVGVTIAFPVFLVGYLRLQGGESWFWALAITAGVSAFLAVLFRQILQLPMYPGVFG